MFDLICWFTMFSARGAPLLSFLASRRFPYAAGKALAMLLFVGLVLLSLQAITAPEARAASAYSYRPVSGPSFQQVRDRLLAYYHQWKGVPYQYGGLSKRGVDCSGFVHLAFKNALGVEVPRSTELLSRIRTRVASSKLRPGDIILFRTDTHTLHAGIYVGDGQFIHASKSKGVMLSGLGNPYWSGAYVKAVRINDLSA